MDPEVILVDDKDKKIGYGHIEKTHLGQGQRHRAFVTLIINFKGEVLLQKRKHRLFDGLWDVTAISHPLHFKNHDESFQEASDRALLKEMGIGHVPVRDMVHFNYFAKDGKNCENENCAVLVGNYSGKYTHNPKEVYESKWLLRERLESDLLANPGKYTPWAVLAIKKLKGKKLQGDFEVDFRRFLTSYEVFKKRYFERKIKEAAKISAEVSTLYNNLKVFMEEGKKLRGYLVWLGYRISGGRDVQKILPVCLGVEILHSFFLVHDDIMDNAALRRGRPTIHTLYAKKKGKDFGISMGILLGDIAAFEAFYLLETAGFEAKKTQEMMKNVFKTATETGWGQTLDMMVDKKRAKIGNLWEIINLKTARYSVVSPLVLGARLGGADKKQVEVLERFGLYAGAAFQLHDDILGVFGSQKSLGKPVLSDMIEGKNTILIYKARQLAKAQARKRLESLWGKTGASLKDLETVKKVITASGALEWCQKEEERLILKAMRELSKIKMYNDIQPVFAQMSDFIIERNS